MAKGIVFNINIDIQDALDNLKKLGNDAKRLKSQLAKGVKINFDVDLPKETQARVKSKVKELVSAAEAGLSDSALKNLSSQMAKVAEQAKQAEPVIEKFQELLEKVRKEASKKLPDNMSQVIKEVAANLQKVDPSNLVSAGKDLDDLSNKLDKALGHIESFRKAGETGIKLIDLDQLLTTSKELQTLGDSTLGALINKFRELPLSLAGLGDSLRGVVKLAEGINLNELVARPETVAPTVSLLSQIAAWLDKIKAKKA